MTNSKNRRDFLFGVAGLAGAGLMATPVLACVGVSCSTAEWQATREPYRGTTAPAQVSTCVRLLASKTYNEMTEVILVEGDDAERGRVNTSLGRGAGHAFSLSGSPDPDIYIREFCFEGRLIANLSAITFCNGFHRGDGNHHTLSLSDASAPYLQRLKRTGHVGTFLSLLGQERTYSRTVMNYYNSRLYSRLYGTNGDWIGS